MLERILIAVDGSDEALRAEVLGLRLAESFGSRATLLSVIDVRVVEGPAVETLAPLWGEVTGRPFQPEVLRLYRERAEATVADGLARARERGVDATSCVEIGVAEDAILEHAGAADLVVMGRRGEHGGFGRRRLGATLWRVLHRAPCPVLVAPDAPSEDGSDAPVPGTGEVPERPLLAWETGAEATSLDLAVEYCRALGVELRIVHAGDESHDLQLKQMCAGLAGSGVPWEAARLEEPAADAVVEALKRWEGDCLFMGAFGRGRVRDFLFGSNTVEILERTHVPVFVCR